MKLSHHTSPIAEQTAKKYPHYKTYAECQSRAFMMGLFSVVSGASVIFVSQEILKRWIPMTIQMRVMAPVLGGGVIGYVIARRRTKNCQEMWMALEEKHTALTPISAKDSSVTPK